MPCRSFGGMKTHTTLNNSYCAPTDKSEWSDLFPTTSIPKFQVYVMHDGVRHHFVARRPSNHLHWKEISVTRYLDLLHDRIVPWRLEEAGFVPFPDEHNTAMMRWENDAQYTVEVIGGGVYVNNASYNITTFTDLLTLIKFLTPPKK